MADLVDLSNPRDIKRLNKRLRELEIGLRLISNYVSDSPSLPELRDTLEELSHKCQALGETLKAAKPHALKAIHRAYTTKLFRHEVDHERAFSHDPNQPLDPSAVDRRVLFERDLRHFNRLWFGIIQALEQLPNRPGRPAQHLLNEAAKKLARTWTEFTEKPFTVSPKRGPDRAQRFVRAGLKCIVPHATEANIRTALRGAAPKRKLAAKKS